MSGHQGQTGSKEIITVAETEAEGLTQSFGGWTAMGHQACEEEYQKSNRICGC